MVVGVFCKEKGKGVSFEDCANCAKCLPAPVIRSLKQYDFAYQRNVYHVNDVIGCLRKAYYNRKEPQADVFHPLDRLVAFKRGKLFEGLVSSTKWKELPGSLTYKIDRETVKLTGRLDVYDPENYEITEIKSKEIKYNTTLPKQKDVLQLQCYGTIFKDIFAVEKLRLVYFDMNIFRQYAVPFVDKSSWLKERVTNLHVAVRDSKPPMKERSYWCNCCSYAKKCSSLIKIKTSMHK